MICNLVEMMFVRIPMINFCFFSTETSKMFSSKATVANDLLHSTNDARIVLFLI